MNILFGVRTVEGEVVTDDKLRKLGESTSPWAPDGTRILTRGNIGMGVQPVSASLLQPLSNEDLILEDRGNIVAFDGRLDSADELRDALGLPSKTPSDSEIVLAAFDRWGETCFSRFVGDWALVLWVARDRALYLGRDHAGIRELTSIVHPSS